MIYDILKSVFDVVLDKSKSISFKTALFISVIGFVFIVDYCLNFTYNIYITNKLNNLETINRLKIVYQNDSIQTANFKQIETKMLNRRHYLDFLSFHLSKIDFKSKNIDFKSKNIDQKNNQTTNVKISHSNIIRSKFWMVLSSNFFLVIIFIVFIFSPIYNWDKQNKNTILGWFASLIVIAVIILFITWIAYQIPILFNNPVWNYILNFIIHIVFITLFSVLIAKAAETPKK